MIDEDRLAKDKADISSVFNEIESLIKTGRKDYLADSKSPLALKYLLIEAVEAVTDVCQHLLAKTKKVSCAGYVDCILKYDLTVENRMDLMEFLNQVDAFLAGTLKYE